MSPKNVSFRRASRSDWPAIQALLLTHALPTEGAEAHLATFVVGSCGSELVAVAGAEVYGDRALLRSVAVTPVLQRQGVGKSLISLLLQEAKHRGVRQVFLLTTTAADYFPRFGFVQWPRDLAPPALQASAQFQGVCPDSAVFMGVTLGDEGSAEGRSGCCGGPARDDASACCAVDEQQKAQGEHGCGCSPLGPKGEATRCCG